MSHSGTMNGTFGKDAEQATANDCGVVGTLLTDDVSAPEWIELIPAGEFEGRDGRGPYRLDDPSEVIAATRSLRMEAGLPIDYDHATDLAAPEGRPAPAAGWIREFSARQGALWGRVEWTGPGAEAVATHEYRYISPVFEYAKDGQVVRWPSRKATARRSDKQSKSLSRGASCARAAESRSCGGRGRLRRRRRRGLQ
jgi:hypothetical protein